LLRVLAVVVPVCVLVAVVFSSGTVWQPAERSATTACRQSPEQSLELVAGSVDGSEATRPVYPYSVIPGGAFSAEDLVAAAQRDPVVAEHYRGIDLAELRVERVSEATVAHVSYRVDDQVFWTRNPVSLRPGEFVLTDGVNQIRARCGNRIAATPLGPTQAQDPNLEWRGTVFADADLTPGGEPSLMASSSLAPFAGTPAASYAAPGSIAAGGGNSSAGAPGVGGAGGGSPSAMRPALSVNDLLPDPAEDAAAPQALAQPLTPEQPLTLSGGPGSSGPGGPGGSGGPGGPGGSGGSGTDEGETPAGPTGGGPGGGGGAQESDDPPVAALFAEQRTPSQTPDEGDGEASIPEPATMWLLGGGLAALACRRLRRSR
jgi:hypothetical protein